MIRCDHRLSEDQKTQKALGRWNGERACGRGPVLIPLWIVSPNGVAILVVLDGAFWMVVLDAKPDSAGE